MSTIEVESSAVALREEQPHAVAASGLFGTVSPVQVVQKATEVAEALADVIEKQKLFKQIGAKKHVLVEGWTLLGSMLGVFPVLVWCRRLESIVEGDAEGWEARVEARNAQGNVIGAAEGQCDRSEDTWKNRDDYALRSMAQTRATSKCLRMPLGFVMTLAGYSATPAEEMPRENAPGRSREVSAPTRAAKAAPAKSEAANPAKEKGADQAKYIKILRSSENFMAASKEDKDKAEAFGAKCKAKFLKAVREADLMEEATTQATEMGWILDTESLEQMSIHHAPLTAAEFEKFMELLKPKPTKGTADPEPNPKPAGADAHTSSPVSDWRTFPIPFGKQAGIPLGELPDQSLRWWCETYVPKPFKGAISDKDQTFRDTLDDAAQEMGYSTPPVDSEEVEY